VKKIKGEIDWQEDQGFPSW